MNSSQPHKSTDLQNPPPDSGLKDNLEAMHPPAFANIAGLSRQEDERFFNLCVDLLGVANFDSGCLERVNPAWTVSLGWSAAELTSQPWLGFVHPDDHASSVQAYGQLMQGKTLHEFENRYRCKDGSFKRLSWNVHPAVDSRQLFCVARDVAEKALPQLQLLKAAMSHLNDIVLITEAEPFDEPGPRIIFVNEAFERRTGYTQEEVIGKSPRFLQGPKTDRAELDRIGRAIRAWQPVRAELINYTKDKKEFWLELDINPITDSEGRFTHWVAVERDITERKMTQEAILRLNSELEDRVSQRTRELHLSNKELEAFSYSVSHDLRSPLATINGFSQLLLKSDKEQLSEKSRHYISRIHAGSVKMGELIEGLLSLARLSRSELNRQEVDVTALSSKIVQELRDAEPERVVEVTVQPGLTINGDVAMVTVVMHNLIANAWKYSSRVPLARIEIGSEMSAQGLTCIFVRDNGVGFDMAYSEKLFQMFQRLHQDTEFKGTGIGLANVKRVVERHGGRVWAQAVPDKGATFRFTLHQTA